MLIVGAVLIAGVAAASVATKAGVPVLVAFLALGMLLGSDGIGGIYFEGGLTTPWKAIQPVLVPASLLSTLGVFVSMAICAVATHAVFTLSWPTAFLLGAVVASTDAAAVFSTLRFTTLRRRLAHLLELESGANDPMAVALTIGLIEWISQPSSGVLDIVLLIVRQLGAGLVIGLAVGAVASAALCRLPARIAPFAPVASVAVGAIAFGLADLAGGSGFLSIYVVGLRLGNTVTPLRRPLLAFHEGLAFLAQVGLFVVLGLLVFPGRLGHVALPGLAVAGVLVFVARPVAVWLSTLWQGFDLRERALLGWAGLRGAVPIVLATFPLAEHVPGSTTIFNAVFFVVVLSALLQGPTLAPLARALGLTTEAAAYQPPLEITAVESLGSDLLEHLVAAGAALAGAHVRELGLPSGALAVVLVRGGEAIPPRGDTRLAAGDRLYVLTREESRAAVQQLLERWAQPRTRSA